MELEGNGSPARVKRMRDASAETVAEEPGAEHVFNWVEAATNRSGRTRRGGGLVPPMGTVDAGEPDRCGGRAYRRMADLQEAAQNIAARRMTMELSMSIAIIAAAAISEFFTALVITLFVLVAEVLENMTVSRGRRAIRDCWSFCRDR